MGYLAYYRGQGTKMMAGVKEYVVIFDTESVPTVEDTDGMTAPGFKLESTLEILGDVSYLPCEEILIKRG